MSENKIEELEKRIANLELFAKVVFQGMVGMRQFLTSNIKENDNGTQEQPAQSEAK